MNTRADVQYRVSDIVTAVGEVQHRGLVYDGNFWRGAGVADGVGDNSQRESF